MTASLVAKINQGAWGFLIVKFENKAPGIFTVSCGYVIAPLLPKRNPDQGSSRNSSSPVLTMREHLVDSLLSLPYIFSHKRTTWITKGNEERVIREALTFLILGVCSRRDCWPHSHSSLIWFFEFPSFWILSTLVSYQLITGRESDPSCFSQDLLFDS